MGLILPFLFFKWLSSCPNNIYLKVFLYQILNFHLYLSLLPDFLTYFIGLPIYSYTSTIDLIKVSVPYALTSGRASPLSSPPPVPDIFFFSVFSGYSCMFVFLYGLWYYLVYLQKKKLLVFLLEYN